MFFCRFENAVIRHAYKLNIVRKAIYLGDSIILIKKNANTLLRELSNTMHLRVKYCLKKSSI